MEQLTLAHLFGVNAIQDSQTLIIQKSDLPLLTPSVSNTAESLLIALLLKVLETFQGSITDDDGNPITDDSQNSITYDNQNLYEFLNSFRWNDNLSVRDGLVIRNTIVIESFEYAED